MYMSLFTPPHGDKLYLKTSHATQCVYRKDTYICALCRYLYVACSSSTLQNATLCTMAASFTANERIYTSYSIIYKWMQKITRFFILWILLKQGGARTARTLIFKSISTIFCTAGFWRCCSYEYHIKPCHKKKRKWRKYRAERAANGK